jgi:type II secretory pathway predicted ATPase ExeA
MRTGIAMINLNRIHREKFSPSDMRERSKARRVYMDFFQFKCPPFAITPDPEFLFLSETHRNAIEKIQYGIQSRQGFMLLTGEVGTGKSTLCRVILDLLQEEAQTVYVINPSLSGQELLATILDDLGVVRAGDASKKTLIDQLNAYLLSNASTRPVVIIIDDAQTMSSETLEDMRLLSNLETDKDKLLQVLLVGQPELQTQIDQPQMRQLRQRVAVSCGLDFLTKDEVGRYIERRLFIAGSHTQARFTPQLVQQIHKKSKGVPRLINKICDLALTAAYTADTCVVDIPHLKIASDEIVELRSRKGDAVTKSRRRVGAFGMVLAAGFSLVIALGVGFGIGPLSRAKMGPGDKALVPKTEVVPVATTAGAKAMPIPASVDDAPRPMLSLEQAGDKAGRYILQLGSFNTLETTLRAIDIYAAKKIEAYWAALPGEGKKVWYRVYAGRFASRQTAQAYQQVNALEGAVIRYAPWTVAVGGAGSTEQILVLRELLKVYQLDGYQVPGEGDQWHLLSGAFMSRKGAEMMASQIRQRTGMSTRIADLNRHWSAENGQQTASKENSSS